MKTNWVVSYGGASEGFQSYGQKGPDGEVILRHVQIAGSGAEERGMKGLVMEESSKDHLVEEEARGERAGKGDRERHRLE